MKFFIFRNFTIPTEDVNLLFSLFFSFLNSGIVLAFRAPARVSFKNQTVARSRRNLKKVLDCFPIFGETQDS